jgi:hypothetical protein
MSHVQFYLCASSFFMTLFGKALFTQKVLDPGLKIV